jgi:hypothetical protein
MRGYQSMMGDIQDVEVLLTTLDKFLGGRRLRVPQQHGCVMNCCVGGNG